MNVLISEVKAAGRQYVGVGKCSAMPSIVLLLGALLEAQSLLGQTQPSFPDTDTLLPRIVQHQKEVETQLNQYTFTETTTTYALGKKGEVRGQHTDVYYITPTAYEFFSLHISHDGKLVSENDLKKQEKEIEQKIQENEKRAERPGAIHPKDNIILADIILKSRFTPLRWDTLQGKQLIVYAFEPKSSVQQRGELGSRVAGDMKGKMWINPDDAAVVRVDFTSVSSLSLGMGFLGNVKDFQGYVEQRKTRGDLWLPSHQEFVAQGRQLISGFRIRQVSDFTDYLKATTDVFQQIHSPKAAAENAN